MCVFNFEDGMTAESWYAWLAFRSRVSMSAIGSVIVMGCGASLAAVPHVSREFGGRGPVGERWSCGAAGASAPAGWSCLVVELVHAGGRAHQLDLRTPGSSPA